MRFDFIHIIQCVHCSVRYFSRLRGCWLKTMRWYAYDSISPLCNCRRVGIYTQSVRQPAQTADNSMLNVCEWVPRGDIRYSPSSQRHLRKERQGQGIYIKQTRNAHIDYTWFLTVVPIEKRQAVSCGRQAKEREFFCWRKIVGVGHNFCFGLRYAVFGWCGSREYVLRLARFRSTIADADCNCVFFTLK